MSPTIAGSTTLIPVNARSAVMTHVRWVEGFMALLRTGDVGGEGNDEEEDEDDVGGRIGKGRCASSTLRTASTRDEAIDPIRIRTKAGDWLA